jgi:hypothetical protein
VFLAKRQIAEVAAEEPGRGAIKKEGLLRKPLKFVIRNEDISR